MIITQEMLNNLIPVFPALGLIAAGCILLAIGLFQAPSPQAANESHGHGWAWGSLAVLLVIWGSWLFSSTQVEYASSLFRTDLLSRSGTHLALLAGCLITALTINKAPSRHACEFHSCLLFLIAGLALVTASSNLTSLYLSLELISIPTVLLLSISRRDNAGREATLKYFALSAFSSAIFLMGASYLFGLAGTTSIDGLVRAIGANSSTMAYIGFVLVIAGLAFRVTAVPFHFYASDVFSGSSLPMAAMLSTIPKIAGFVAMIKLLGGPTLNAALVPVALTTLILLALATMTLGNCLALVQSQCRKLLAYSSIAHSGYIMLGLAALLVQGASSRAVLVYLAAYVIMTIGFFAGISTLRARTDQDVELNDLNGLTSTNLWLGISLSICVLSLIGIPITAGFWAKFEIFRGLLTPGDRLLLFAAVFMAINAAIGAIYYVDILIRLNSSTTAWKNVSLTTLTDKPAIVTCVFCACMTLVWFIVPTWM